MKRAAVEVALLHKGRPEEDENLSKDSPWTLSFRAFEDRKQYFPSMNEAGMWWPMHRYRMKHKQLAEWRSSSGVYPGYMFKYIFKVTAHSKIQTLDGSQSRLADGGEPITSCFH
jgi:hypothetical protein